MNMNKKGASQRVELLRIMKKLGLSDENTLQVLEILAEHNHSIELMEKISAQMIMDFKSCQSEEEVVKKAQKYSLDI